MCIDTAHLWGSGLTMEKAMPLIPLDEVILWHLNGNSYSLGSGNDKH